MKKKTTNNNSEAINVGSYIDKDLFTALRETYLAFNPNTNSSFIIDKRLLQAMLDSASNVTGIRFMYGLADLLNPNSIRILLIPCTSEGDSGSKPIISTTGYYDHLGELHSLHDIAGLIANYVQHVVKTDASIPYKQVTRGSFFGKNSLNDLMKDQHTMYMSYHFGMAENVLKPILQPLNGACKLVKEVYMDDAEECPPLCPEEGETCLATMAVQLNSGEKELDMYRQFRDNELLKLSGGGRLYETYYFISPLIASVISRQESAETILKQIYSDMIVPVKQLLLERDYNGALAALQEAYDILIAEYAVVFEKMMR